MQFFATGAFFAAMVLYCISRTLENVAWQWGFLRAFSEAAMIGAAADWFAVVALFRHPFGIPIPHTAVIPRHKDRIGANLARLVETEFLTKERIMAKLKEADLGNRFALWLSDAKNAAVIAHRLGEAIPRVFDALNDEGMRAFLRQHVSAQIHKLELSPLIGRLAETYIAQGRHQELFTEGLKIARSLIAENVGIIQEKIEAEFPHVYTQAIDAFPLFREPLLSLRSQLAHALAVKVAEKTQTVLDEALHDPDHPSRLSLNKKAAEVIGRIKTTPEVMSTIDHFKDQIVDNPAFQSSIDTLWAAIKEEVAADLASENSTIREHLRTLVQAVGTGLQTDHEFRERMEGWLLTSVSSVLEKHGHAVGDLITETVRSWDAKQVVARLEPQVGSDLQFIRLNGTFVGGMCGLIIYAVSLVIWR